MSSDLREPPKLESWGPSTQVHEVRVIRTSALVARRLGISMEEASQRLMEQTQGRHRYLIFHELGRSTHAVVYSAIDQLLARDVALKIHQQPPSDVDRWNIFREARTQVLFEHDNIVRLLDAGHCDGHYYWVTELCDEDLATWSRGKPWAVVLRRIIEAGRGLEAVHAAGIVHSDVKPRNIMVKGGVAKLGDFGMSGAPGETLAVGGTAGYIAPEVVTASSREAASDVFSLACTAWACVFGVLPYQMPPDEMDDEAALVFLLERARVGAVLEPPAGEVPGRIVEVLARGLEPDPRERPLLNEWLSELEWCVSIRTGGGRRYVGGIAAAAALVLVGVGLHASLSPRAEVQPAPAPAPSIRPAPEAEEAPASAKAREPSAWDAYIEESTVEPLSAERVLQHARSLVEEAEETSSTEKAGLAIYVLSTPGMAKNEKLEQEVAELSARARLVLKGRSSPPSRRD